MPVKIEIDDLELANFTQPAKDKLEAAGREYVIDLIREANRLEAVRRGSGQAEVTQVMVQNATISQTYGLSPPKKKWMTVGLKVVASISSLVLGLVFDFDKLSDHVFAVILIVILVFTILTNTASIVKE